MMFDVSKKGTAYVTSSLAQFTNAKTLMKSYELPNSDKSLIIQEKALVTDKNGNIIGGEEISPSEILLPDNLYENELFRSFCEKHNVQPTILGDRTVVTFKALSDFVNTLPAIQKIEFYRDLLITLKQFADGKTLVYGYISQQNNPTDTSLLNLIQQQFDQESLKLIKDLNRHNSRKVTTNQLKNRIMYNMYQISTDIHNLESAQQPMDASLVNDPLERVERTTAGYKAPQYTFLSPVTKWKIQYENSVGKDNVGIAANGVKANGAMQQHYNLGYQQQTIDPKYKIDIDLTFRARKGSGSKLNYHKRFVKIANIKVTRDQFIEQLCSGIDFSQDQDYLALKALGTSTVSWDRNQKLVTSTNEEISFENFYDDYQYQGQLNPRMERLLSEWKSFKESTGYNGEITQDIYKDFLYYRSQFEDNAADLLSVFISLSVDNAKELKLKRLNCLPELMSIPLAMITLGVDIYTTVQVCVTLLDVIAQDLSQNRFQQNVYTDVRKIIYDRTYGSKNKEAVFDKETGESLLKVYDFAQEMRMITSFFKVNQGVSGKYSELLSWIDGLSNAKLNTDKNWSQQITLPNKTKITKFDLLIQQLQKVGSAEALNRVRILQKYYNQPIDFKKLFKDSNYKSELVKYFELLKTGINSLDIILTSPNFSQQLEGVSNVLTQLGNISFTSALTQMLTKGLDINEDNETGVSNNKKSNTKDRTSTYKQIQSIADHLFTHLLFKELKYTFKYGDIKEKFPQVSLPFGYNSVFSLSSNGGLNSFVDLMNSTIIPSLIENYKTNFFFASLEEVSDRSRTNRNKWQVKYNAYEKADKAEAENINQAKTEFERVMKNSSGLKTVDGKDISIGEALYLYDLAVNKGMNSGLRICTRSTKSYTTIDKQYNDIIKRLDNATEEASINDGFQAMLQNNPDLQGIDFIALREALATDTKSATVTRNKENIEYDLSDSLLYTAVIPQKQRTIAQYTEDIKKTFSDNKLGNIDIQFKHVDTTLIVNARITQGNRTLNIEQTYENVDTNEYLPASVARSLTELILENAYSTRDIINEYINSVDSTIYQFDDFMQQIENSTSILKLFNSLNDKNVVILVNKDPNLKKSFVVELNDGQKYVVIRESAISGINLSELIDTVLTANLSWKNQIVSEESKKELLRKLVSDKTIIDSYEGYLENEKMDSTFKTQCLYELRKMEQALSLPAAFFYKRTVDSKNHKSGDQFQKDGKVYIYLGKKKGINHTLVEKPFDGMDRTPEILQVSDKQLESYEKIASIKRNPQYSLSELTPGMFNYHLESKKQIDEINILDKVILKTSNGTQEFLVTDIVYDEINGKNVKQCILYNGTERKIIQGSVIKYRVLSKSGPENLKNNQTFCTLEVSPRIIEEFNLLSKLTSNDKVYDKYENPYTFYEQISDTEILVKTKNGTKNLNVSDISKIEIIGNRGSLILDDKFNWQSQPVMSVARNKSTVMSNSEIVRVNNLINPEKSRNVFTLQSNQNDVHRNVPRNSELKFNAESSFEFIPKIENEYNNGNMLFSFKDGKGFQIVSLTDYTVITNPNVQIAEGDIVQTNSDVTGLPNGVYKIVQIDGNFAYLMTNSFNDVFNRNSTNIVKVPLEMLNNLNDIKLFSQREEAIKENSQMYEEPNVDVSIKTLLSDLEESLHTSITLRQDVKETWFAKVDENGIQINISQKPENMTLHQYVAEQSLHEFTHIALSKIQMDSPEVYFELVKYIQNMAKDNFRGMGANQIIQLCNNIWSEIKNDSTYSSDTEKAEEFIVRYIQQTSRFNEQVDSFISDSINVGFRFLFSGLPRKLNVNYEHSLINILQEYRTNPIDQVKTLFNFRQIINESLALKMFDNIEKIC